MRVFFLTTNSKTRKMEGTCRRIAYFAFSSASVSAGMISKMSPTTP